jgi:tRNA A37 threonylcarbamoyladenosine synthetase subunit TsaC/SUA5/YrdC
MVSLSKHLLQLGEIAVIPTDTVYGVVARLEDPKAVARLYALKQRERKPGTVVAATIAQLAALGMRQQDLLKVKDFWPAALSVIVPCDDTLLYAHQGVGSRATSNDSGRGPSIFWQRRLLVPRWRLYSP